MSAGGQPLVVQEPNALSAVAAARWTVFDARGIPLYRAAARELEATKLESADSRRLLAFEAGDAFLQTLSSQAVVDAARRRVDFAQQAVKDSGSRQAAGLVSVNDVTRAQLEAATAERELTRATSTAETARIQLAWLLDAAPGELDALERPAALLETAASASPELSAQALAKAQDSRLDVAAAVARAAQAGALSDEPNARLFPTLSLVAQYRLTNEPGLSGRVGGGSFGVDLAWALFDGGDRYGERRQRLAEAQSASLQARLRQRKVAFDVQAALVSLKSAQASLAQAKVASDVAQKNATETEELYRQGLASTLQVADASLRRFEAEVELARGQYGLALSLLDLRAAIGVDPLGREVTP
ncbi:MAG: Outer rane efflux protein [Myxococcaceae bacterium]|nr:Outer rane efflux protein [Myxococcaceae bacterium]